MYQLPAKQATYQALFQILWENQKLGDRPCTDGCYVSVDTEDSPFQQLLIPHPTKPGKNVVNKLLFPYKLNGPGL